MLRELEIPDRLRPLLVLLTWEGEIGRARITARVLHSCVLKADLTVHQLPF